MKEFKDKVALITGAANGFGKEFAKEAASKGMKLALVDIEKEEVEAVCAEVKNLGVEAIAIHCDVTKFEEVEKAVNTVMDTYGQIDLLMNNAGIAIPGFVWDVPVRDWEWITHLNVLSHVYFMKLVIPIMMEQKTHCHIVNTASVAGMITSNGMPAYHTTKHAAVALAESVSYDLQAVGADIAVSVYCPGFVQTDLHHSERHRPDQYRDDSDPYYKSKEFMAGQKTAEHVIVTGIPIDSVGMRVFQGIEDEDFYILTHPIYTTLIGKRVTDMLGGKGPDLKSLRG
ncbi:MAG: SDR family NAD(P)-dependent oxidoreductase [Pseudobutyrivibrio sp.]|nr:SDR family NAD(P)-dependent oxidoreductase [Pseudobutyrivibrio sp.]